jgi:hypothetical protein
MKDGFGTVSDDSTTVTGSDPQPNRQTRTEQGSDGDSGLTLAAKAGIAVALIGGILLGLLLAFGISYWKKKRKSKSRGDTSDPVGRMEGGVSAVQVLETRQCESES